MHNVTSVYSAKQENEKSDAGAADPSMEGQFSEYSMDDVEQGPIHGGGGKETELWAAYNTVNRKFAEVVVQCFNEGDLVWIHGFHLLILPSYLTRRIPMAKVGIFLHTPFPSSEIFRTLWCREDLLRGMLNADQVGFHLFEYARHFLTCCRRLLGLNYGMIPDASGGHTLAIDTNGRHVAVTSIHAGIEPPVLNQILSHKTTYEKTASIRNRFFGKTIFCAVDRLESLKGIPLKLLGLERFLRRCPEWVGKLVLIQIGISAYERGDDYVKTKKEVVEMTNRINQIWPGTIEFQECAESEMRLQQRMALLRAADVVLVTSIRDGLNLIPLVSLPCNCLLRPIAPQLTISFLSSGVHHCAPRCAYGCWKTRWAKAWTMHFVGVLKLYACDERCIACQSLEDLGDCECIPPVPPHDRGRAHATDKLCLRIRNACNDPAMGTGSNAGSQGSAEEHQPNSVFGCWFGSRLSSSWYGCWLQFS
jgi:glycosyltransferase involved in cell wall biosynthesis